MIDCIEFLLNCEVLFRWTHNKLEVLNPSGSILEGSPCQQCSPPTELKSHIDVVHFIHFQKNFSNMPLFLFLLSRFPLKIFSCPYEIANNTQPFILHCHLLLFSWFYCILKAEAFQCLSLFLFLYLHICSPSRAVNLFILCHEICPCIRACFCPSLILASVDPSVSRPVLCPGSVSGFCLHLCSLCPTTLEILYLKLEERLFKVKICWMSEIQVLKEMQQKRCQQGNSPVSSFFSVWRRWHWEPALGVCFAWSLSILGVSCGFLLPSFVPRINHPGLLRWSCLSVPDLLWEECSTCPPGAAPQLALPPGPGLGGSRWAVLHLHSPYRGIRVNC